MYSMYIFSKIRLILIRHTSITTMQILTFPLKYHEILFFVLGYEVESYEFNKGISCFNIVNYFSNLKDKQTKTI